MFLLDWFHSFLPLLNPLGFGAQDFILLAAAVLVAGMAFAMRPFVERVARPLAEKPVAAMAVLAALPVTLRLLLIAHHPIPRPEVSDDFSYLLVAGTLRHFRLANPSHALPQFFETYFALQQPTYSSIFPIGPGLWIALGWILTGHPWAGVALSEAALCAACFWMLRAWTTPLWAFAGGLLAVFEFGPLSQWMNSYWGGSVAAFAGCLVFGAAARLRRGPSRRNALLLGAGLGLHVLTRPYESVFLFAAAGFVLAPWRPGLWRSLRFSGVALAPALLLVAAHNKAVTGSWTTLPYQLSQLQYGVPASLTFQPMPKPHRALTPEQQLDYDTQAAVHGPLPDTVSRYVSRLAERAPFYRFFFVAPLFLALPFFLLTLRRPLNAAAASSILLFALGTNFYPYFYTHYIAALTPVFVFVAVASLDRLSQVRLRGFASGAPAARMLFLLAAAHFMFWYGIHLFERPAFAGLIRNETWDSIEDPGPLGRQAVEAQLRAAPGEQLVFVRYTAGHRFHEWVHNPADIDAARIVWARDLGPEANQALLAYYPKRRAWLLYPDLQPPRLTPYFAESATSLP
jgi:hypothetical protein